MKQDSLTDGERPLSIVILGGSYGGISVAHNVLKHTIPSQRQHGQYQITLVSPSTEMFCRPACPRALISEDAFGQHKLFMPITKAFDQYPKGQFSFVHGKATALDHEARTVTVDVSGGGQKTIGFHALVIATGASTPSPLHSMTGDAKDLRDQWRQFREAAKSAKSIVVVGGGPTGVETAAELGEHLKGRTKITLVTAGQHLLPILRPDLAAKAEKMLASVGVSVFRGVRVAQVTPEDAGTVSAPTRNATVTLSDGRVLHADLYIPATGTTPNTAFVPSSLLASDGRVTTDPATLRVPLAGPRVYAIGDASSYARPAVHNILEAVPVLSRNLKSDLLAFAQGGRETQEGGVGKPFKADDGETQLVPIGTKAGVGAMKGWRLPSWAVWAIKGRDYWLWTTPRLWSGRMWEKEG